MPKWKSRSWESLSRASVGPCCKMESLGEVVGDGRGARARAVELRVGDGLDRPAHVVAHRGQLAAKEAGGHAFEEVERRARGAVALREGRDEGRVIGEVGECAQLDLRIVGGGARANGRGATEKRDARQGKASDGREAEAPAHSRPRRARSPAAPRTPSA